MEETDLVPEETQSVQEVSMSLPNPLGTVLEDLSIRVMEASNSNDLDPSISKHIAATFVLDSDLYRRHPGLYKIRPREHVARVWEFAHLNPAWRVDACRYSFGEDIYLRRLLTILNTIRECVELSRRNQRAGNGIGHLDHVWLL